MPHSNGRIYTTQGVGINPVSDVAATIGENSTDVGTICTSKHINLWARYRPIPCQSASNNTPKSITPSQRIAENYGLDQIVDMFTADDDMQFENYANGLDLSQPYSGLKLRPWGDTHFKRITDFVKTDENGNQVHNVGYDHNAQPSAVTVTKGGSKFSVKPVIPEDMRTMFVTPESTSERFEFPNDRYWMKDYFNLVSGTQQPSASTYLTYNEEWLSTLDLISGEYGKEVNTDVVRRGVIMFNKNQSGNWKLYCCADDRSGTSRDVKDRSFSQYPQAYLDLTNGSTTYTFPYGHEKDLGKMEGEFLFVDYWSSSSTNKVPILGLAYMVNIQRIADSTATSINRSYSKWVFTLKETYGVIEIEARSNLQGYVAYDFASVFSSLKLVISTSRNGDYGIKKEWNILAGQYDDSEERQSSTDRFYLMVFEAYDDMGGDINPDYDGMYAVLVGEFISVEQGDTKKGTLAIELHRRS